MGYPATGKTTYLAALWYTVTNALTSADIKYELSTMNDEAYLCQIVSKWLNAEQLDRTLLEQEQPNICIELKNKNDNSVFKLSFPDLSGETFSNIYANRKIKKTLISSIENADIIMLFINVENVYDVSFIPENGLSLNESDSLGPKMRKPERDDLISIQIIELLQIVNNIKKNTPINLRVIISAWDLAKSDVTPEKYLQKRINILWQFLESNKDIFDTQFWGVSAQGGDLEKDSGTLLEIANPIDRIRVVNNLGETSKDITLPILGKLNE